MDTAEQDDEMVPFHEWLAKHRHGDASTEWAERLSEVVAGCRLVGKKGSLTIRIDVDPSGRTVVVTDRLTTKIPEPDREAAIYYATDDGRLSREDRLQGRLPLANALDEGMGLVDPETGEIQRKERNV